MKNRLIITLLTSFALAGGLFAFANSSSIQFNPAQSLAQTEAKTETLAPKKETVVEQNINTAEYMVVEPLFVVANPSQYLNKKIKFKASFDKFSTLGLDYKPAFRDSQKYISFLIKRPDVTDHTVPLSEMKIFITRDVAEKFIDLDSGDVVEIYGKVFSSALTDAWVDVDKLVVIDKKNKDEKKK